MDVHKAPHAPTQRLPPLKSQQDHREPLPQRTYSPLLGTQVLTVPSFPPTPQMKSQNLPSIRVKLPLSKDKTHTKEVARKHRKEEEVRINISISLFFFLIIKKLFGRSPNATEYNWHHLRYPKCKILERLNPQPELGGTGLPGRDGSFPFSQPQSAEAGSPIARTQQ